MRIDDLDIDTCLADAVDGEDSSAPLSVPIVQTSLFAFPSFDALLEGLGAEHRYHVYTRGQNPTVEALERKLARLERGDACKCFASGMAAVSAVLIGLLEAGDHVIFANNVYGPTLQLADRLERFGITHDIVLSGNAAEVEHALRPNTRLLWLESPGTMLFRVIDVPALAALARARGILTCADNSWATPLLQKPLLLGADIVVHSGSKYLAGHSDVMAGAVITKDALIERIFYNGYLLLGGALSPHDAWLMLRGMRTLPARLRQQESDALQIATFLREHPAVREVFHPALAGEAALVERQLAGFTGLFSFRLVRDDFDSVRRVIDALRRFRIGVSWGGVESLVLSPQRADSEARHGIPAGLIRLSIGLEGADALIADLERALQQVA